jgi:hypothetical protein
MTAQASYRQLLDLSERMLTAGMAQHWDELIDLERQRNALLYQTLGASYADSPPQPKIELIGKIQLSDTQLREKIDAWLADARILLRLDKPHAPKAE